MGRCPWHGEVCNCGLGWPFPENGLMPQRCEDRTPLYQVGAFPNQSRRKKGNTKIGSRQVSQGLDQTTRYEEARMYVEWWQAATSQIFMFALGIYFGCRLTKAGVLK